MLRKKWKGICFVIVLPYGKGDISIDLEPTTEWDIVVYDGRTSGACDSIIRKALDQPVDSPKLQSLAAGKQNAVILISDITRLCPSYRFITGLLDELNAGGIPDAQIQIVVALGLHRKQTSDEIRSLVGEEAIRRVRVLNHSAIPEDCVHLGVTSHGTPIEINRTVAEADLRVVTGSIEPHSLVGMSGGIKALVPGVASWTCIEANHSLSQKFKATPGNPDNPIHQDLEEALHFIGIDFLFNVIVNHRREIIDAVAGHVIQAHRQGVQRAREKFIVPVDRRYDIVVASAGGHPKDMQLYQAVKSLMNAATITKSGGSILLAARCEEQFGNGIFQYWTEVIQDRSRIVQMLNQQFVMGAHKIAHIDQILSQHDVYLYSELSPATVELIGFRPVQDLQETLRSLTSNPEHRVALMPHASITFPQLIDN
jgi:lactate racemase